MLVGDGHGRIPVEGRSPGQHLVKDAAGRIEVGAHVHTLAAGLFGAQVLSCTHHALGLGHSGGRVVHGPGDAEVHDFDDALLRDHDVAGLDVPVDDAHMVGVVQGTQHAQHDLLAVALAQGAVLLEDGPQGLALDVLHDKVGHPLMVALVVGQYLLARVVDGDDVGVVEQGDRVGLPPEAR